MRGAPATYGMIETRQASRFSCRILMKSGRILALAAGKTGRHLLSIARWQRNAPPESALLTLRSVEVSGLMQQGPPDTARLGGCGPCGSGCDSEFGERERLAVEVLVRRTPRLDGAGC